jgi:hypothetical protein
MADATEKSTVGPRMVSAEEWIRLFREQPLPNLTNAFYCPACNKGHIFASNDRIEMERCHITGAALYRLDEEFWMKLSKLMKQAYRKDKSLVARVKAEFPEWPLPTLEQPFSWMNTAWIAAPLPRGRPQTIVTRLFVAYWVNALSAPHYTFTVKPDGKPYFEFEETDVPESGRGITCELRRY